MPDRSASADGFEFPVLIGDVGGTNARFRVVDGGETAPEEVTVVKVADFPTIDAAILAALQRRGGEAPRSAIVAVAGPVEGDSIQLTNCDWAVKPRDLFRLGLDDVVVLNDFEAQALAVVALGPEHLQAVGAPRVAEPEAGRVVLGPGTGLGVAGLIHSRGRWIPVPGEGGHMDLGPRTARDRAIFPHLEAIEGRISGEQILCGRGLVNLYRALAKADGAAAVHRTPAEVATAGLDGGGDPLAAETLELFVTYLGRTAGDLALVFKSTGGVFLSGGIAQKIVPALQKPHFRAAFEDKAPHRELMRAMPVSVITHPLAAVIGLAAYARSPERFGIETAGRRWRKAPAAQSPAPA